MSKKSEKEIRGRKWCLTLNNYTVEEYENYKKIFYTYNTAIFIIGKEIGKCGTPHLQIYFETKNALSFFKVKKMFDRAHIEKALGNLKQNFIYCTKDGDFITNLTESQIENLLNRNSKKNMTESEIMKMFLKEGDNKWKKFCSEFCKNEYIELKKEKLSQLNFLKGDY